VHIQSAQSALLKSSSSLLKNSAGRLLKKISEARRAKIDPSAFAQDRLGERRTYAVRWSEAIERNEAYEFFSAACLRRFLALPQAQ
jgi:hypothetical protein